MDYRVRMVDDKRLKSKIADRVLRALPEWFGIEEALVAYVDKSQNTRFWAAYVSDQPVGFLSLLPHNSYTSEIYCMGLDPVFHRHGIGTTLMEACEESCRKQGTEFLTVKTLDESKPDDAYAKTRQFYIARGFRPLEVFPTLWGERNPCLFLAKNLLHLIRD